MQNVKNLLEKPVRRRLTRGSQCNCADVFPGRDGGENRASSRRLCRDARSRTPGIAGVENQNWDIFVHRRHQGGWMENFRAEVRHLLRFEEADAAQAMSLRTQ